MIIANLFQQRQEFTVGLVEGLFTLDDFTNDISIVYYSVFFQSKYGLQALRDGWFTLESLKNYEHIDQIIAGFN